MKYYVKLKEIKNADEVVIRVHFEASIFESFISNTDKSDYWTIEVDENENVKRKILEANFNEYIKIIANYLFENNKDIKEYKKFFEHWQLRNEDELEDVIKKHINEIIKTGKYKDPEFFCIGNVTRDSFVEVYDGIYYILENENGEEIFTLKSYWSNEEIFEYVLKTKNLKIVKTGRCTDENELKTLIDKYK